MDFFIGQIGLFAFNYVPNGWLACSGALLPIQQYSALFSRLGFTFGGDGSHFFALPNLTTNVPFPGMIYGICFNGIYPEPP